MFKKIVGLGFSAKGKNAKNVEKYIAGLVESGAGEFFVGYNPDYWYTKFGFEVSPNGRFAEHEQVTDFETLKTIVIESHKHNIEIFANLNAWYYTPETMPLIKKMVAELIGAGVDGIICGNISILEYLREIDYKGLINISTIMAVYNKEAIGFFIENYKINKFILSREVTLKEIEELTKTFKNTKFEVFGEGDFCRYNNGLCFAEHKYGAKDICTIVVNDLVIKKRFRPDFKEFILDENLSNKQKLDLIDDSYKSDFEIIEELIGKIELGLLENNDLLKDLEKIILKNKSHIDLYFDVLQTLDSKHNKNILSYFKGIKVLLKDNTKGDKKGQTHRSAPTENVGVNLCVHPELNSLEQELTNSFKSYINYHKKKVEELGGEAKLKALELAGFYSRNDNLNLYSYLFFSKISNIDTVKFPTRGRNYAEKIKLIEEVVKSGEIDKNLIDRTISLDRIHYDLTYLFGEELWFRKIVNKKAE